MNEGRHGCRRCPCSVLDQIEHQKAQAAHYRAGNIRPEMVDYHEHKLVRQESAKSKWERSAVARDGERVADRAGF